MPIGTLSMSSTRATIPVICIPSPLFSLLQQPSVPRRARVSRFVENDAAAQFLDSVRGLEEHRYRNEREAAEQHCEKRPHRKRQALRAAFVLEAVLHLGYAPPDHGKHEQERDDEGDELDDLGGAPR